MRLHSSFVAGQILSDSPSFRRGADANFGGVRGIYRRKDAIFARAEGIYRRTDAIFARAGGIYRRTDAIFARAEGIYRRTDAIFSRPIGIFYKEIMLQEHAGSKVVRERLSVESNSSRPGICLEGR